MKYRIIKADKYNWDIEEAKEAGAIISRGPYAGQPMKAGWKPSERHYNSLKTAALGLIDVAAGDALLTGEATTILEALKQAEAIVLETLAAMEPQYEKFDIEAPLNPESQ